MTTLTGFIPYLHTALRHFTLFLGRIDYPPILGKATDVPGSDDGCKIRRGSQRHRMFFSGTAGGESALQSHSNTERHLGQMRSPNYRDR